MIAAKPVPTLKAFDLCYLTGDTTFATPVTDMALCDADPRLAKHASPRQVAGGSIRENILKCQLKPLNIADYAPVAFTAGAARAAASRVRRPASATGASRASVSRRRSRH